MRCRGSGKNGGSRWPKRVLGRGGGDSELRPICTVINGFFVVVNVVVK